MQIRIIRKMSRILVLSGVFTTKKEGEATDYVFIYSLSYT